MQPAYAQLYPALDRHHWWWQARRQLVLSHVGRLARQRPLRQILDLGCAGGLLFDALARFGQVHGLEPDPTLVPADSPHRARIEIAPFTPAYAAPRRYDLVLMLDVLEHLPHDGPAVRHVADLIHPGGFLLLTVPAYPALWSAHDLVNEHHRRYTRLRARQVLEGSGFRVQVLHSCFAWPLPAMLLRRWLCPAHPAAARRYRIGIPAPLLNAACYRLTRTEQTLFAPTGTPLGSTLLAIGQKT